MRVERYITTEDMIPVSDTQYIKINQNMFEKYYSNLKGGLLNKVPLRGYFICFICFF